MFAVLFFLFAYASAGTIVPEWCWFHSYSTESRLLSIVYSYNNTFSVDIEISTESSENRLLPINYNGQQPTLFKSGYNTFAFSLDTVDPNEIITWQIGNQSLAITTATLLTTDRCDTKHNGYCPTWIEHFCEDSVYCNGNESCFTPVLFGMMSTHKIGTCTRPIEGVLCEPFHECHEERMSCVDTRPPPPPPSPIYPSFHCWFYTYESENKMVINLRMNYNNTATNVITRPVGGDIPNSIYPAAYDGVQPALFYPGFQEDSFVIKDTIDFLSNGHIVWQITENRIEISLNDINTSTRCPIDTNHVPDPTPQPVEVQCSAEKPDCSAYNTFCYGDAHCDTEHNLCVLNDAAYTPCSSLTVSPLQLSCVEHLSICVASVNCTADNECNDGHICNGAESCINGTCVFQVNVSIIELCGTADAICIEGRGCVATNPALEDKYIVAIVGAIILCSIVVIVLFVLYFYTTGNPLKKKSKNK